MLKLGFIGAGTVGTALALKMSSQGYHVLAISSLDHKSIPRLTSAVSELRVYGSNQEVADNAELVFITTPDDIIPAIASEINWHHGQYAVHCSGSDSADILEPARAHGARVGVFHPLQTFASTERAVENIPGSTFALEAEEPLLSTLKEMATAIGGHWIELKASDKVIYHVAAVMACNYMVTIMKLASDLWQSFGYDTNQATQALLPLVRATVHNLEALGIPQGLTGPVARGDVGTVKKHIKALQSVSPDILAVYRYLGLQTIPIALAKGGISAEQAMELEAIMK